MENLICKLDEKYTLISNLTSNEFSKDIRNIVQAKSNIYDTSNEIEILEYVIQLLSMGVYKDEVMGILKIILEYPIYD